MPAQLPTTLSSAQPIVDTKAAWAVTTVFLPANITATNNTASLLSYQVPYNTADINYSPSAILYTSAQNADSAFADIQLTLGRGWVVNIPDFEGPTAAFTSGELEGYAVLDSLRAALTLTSTAQVALWGYSGGSIASKWAAELATQYAPELNFAGVAIGGLVANITDLLSRIDDTPAAWLIPAALLGLTSQYPDAAGYITWNLKTSGSSNATGFLATKEYGYPQAVEVYSNHSILNDYFVNGNSTVSESPLLRRLLNTDGQMGYHGVPTMPLYVYKAVKDEYSGIEYTDALVQRYCNVGTNVTYRRNLRGNHLDEYTNGDPAAFAWLIQAFSVSNASFAQPQAGCSIENVTVGTQDHAPFYLPPVFS